MEIALSLPHVCAAQRREAGAARSAAVVDWYTAAQRREADAARSAAVESVDFYRNFVGCTIGL